MSIDERYTINVYMVYLHSGSLSLRLNAGLYLNATNSFNTESGYLI